MQLKIYQRLNQILIGIIIIIIVALAVVIINFGSFDSTTRIIVMVGFFAFTVLSFLGFKMLEYNWDKYLIQKMILKGQVALAEIVSSTPLYPIKDTASRFYRLWQFEVIVKRTEL